MDKEQVIKLMESSKTQEEWNNNCDLVKGRCEGYPEYWFKEIIQSGLASRVLARFGQDDKIRINKSKEDEEKEQEVELILASVSMVTLHNFDNTELSALNLAIHLQGKVPKENLAFDKALDYKLIREDGSIYDLNALKRACECEVNARVEAGTFN